jgi:L(+)-tartrate dehydratase alpha subunit
VRIHADGSCDYRHDPRWFTPYLRRETVEWPTTSHSEKQSV